MFITPAGLPVADPGALGGGRRLSDGRRGQRDQHVVRPGHRHPDDPHETAADSLRPDHARRSGWPSASGSRSLAFAVFWYQVNPLSAWLALGGLLFYVFVYTIWLKRSSPQNIVIGGAAGAFPPLVGWAAMTGGLDLAAVYLFAIIFYWTPPHFWALALIKQADYARAGIPMMPVVRGEARTKYEMLVYTLILLPLTILPFFFGALGPFYAVAAALLGARLLWYCIRVLRERPVTPVAWGMYRYSLLYLALLFVAMGVDRALPFGRPRRRSRSSSSTTPRVRRGYPGKRTSSTTDAPRRPKACSWLVMTDSHHGPAATPPPSAAGPAGPPLAEGQALPLAAGARHPRAGGERAAGARLPDGGPLPARRRVRGARPGAARPHRHRAGGALQRPGGPQLRPGLPAERRGRAVGRRAPARSCSPGCWRCRPASSPSGAPGS